jgi:hypothetical protein
MLRSTDGITWVNVTATGALQGLSGTDAYPTYGTICYSAGSFHTLYSNYWFRSRNGLPGTWETSSLVASPSQMIPTSYGVLFPCNTNTIIACHSSGYVNTNYQNFSGGTGVYTSGFEITGVTVGFSSNPASYSVETSSAIIFNPEADIKNNSNPQTTNAYSGRWITRAANFLWQTGSPITQGSSYGGTPIVSSSGNSVLIVDNANSTIGFMQGQSAIHYSTTVGVPNTLRSFYCAVDTGISLWYTSSQTNGIFKITKGVSSYDTRISTYTNGATQARVGPDLDLATGLGGFTRSSAAVGQQGHVYSYVKIT